VTTPAGREGVRRFTVPVAELLRESRASEDPMLLDAAASGELLVGRIRLYLLIPLLGIQLLPGWDAQLHGVGVTMMLAGIGWSAVALLLVRHRYRPWMGLVSSLVDVTLITIALALFVAVGRPHLAVNSRVAYEFYFLALGCASLRYDFRICLVTGLVALVEYGALGLWVANRYDLTDPAFVAHLDGAYNPNLLMARLVLIAAAALLAAAVVVRAQRLRRLSRLDRLTGLQNRGAFEDRLVVEAIRARRYGRSLAVALLDIDHFKRFNDTHGHGGGDMALKAVAQALDESLRRTDVVARYGGEEFAVLLPETGGDDALAKMESVRRSIDALRIELGRGHEPVAITISIGVAAIPDDGPNAMDVLAVADARLYAAKRAGRDRVLGRPAAGADDPGGPA
jgi:diguanylate cyclase (GGDEF)-like protein